MIERQIIKSNMKELKIQEYITSVLKNLGQSHIKLQRTPLGEKIVIFASRPGLIVGRKGQNIKKLTEDLKTEFKLDNPQIEINEVDVPDLDAQIVAERIASSLEKFGTQRFKGVGHRVMADSMNSGALGIEILITGKIPSSRSKRWRFYQGYLKKCGDIALTGVRKAYTAALLKTGTVGIQVRIMPPETILPDKIELNADMEVIVEEVPIKKEKKFEKKRDTKKSKPNKKAAKKPAKKKAVKKEDKKDVKKDVKKEEKKEKAPKEESKPEPKAEEPKEDKKETPAEDRSDSTEDKK